MSPPATTIVWDWNGTLLDDVDGCVATLNSLRVQRGMLPLSRAEYRGSFGFPVRAFYESIGFDFSAGDVAYAELARDFIAEYRRRGPEMRVAAGARAALTRLAARGIGHLVISAMEARMLEEMLHEHGLAAALAGWHGTGDHGAGSKVAVGVAAVRQAGLDPRGVVVIGDTLHDLELAQAIGCRAILYAGGHQAHERLVGAGVPVIDDFAELDVHLGVAADLALGLDLGPGSAEAPGEAQATSEPAA